MGGGRDLTCACVSVVPSERRGGRLCVALPAGEVEDLQAELRGAELPHLLPAVRRSAGGHPPEVPPEFPGHVQGRTGKTVPRAGVSVSLSAAEGCVSSPA